jgi:hypothetical protein
VPGGLLGFLSLLIVLAAIHTLLVNPKMLTSLVFLGLAVAVLWAMWSRLPLALRQFIRKRILDREKERRP